MYLDKVQYFWLNKINNVLYQDTYGGYMKFYKISTIFLGLFCLVLIICLFQKNDNEILTSNNVTSNKNNALTMMLETDVDSNEYEVATSDEWPQEGYIFNAEMSACERGGTLSWDSENNRVLMATSSADKCYVYFDRYTAVSITNVTTSNITSNSITLTAEATTGENPIATYYFSNNDGLSYEESTSNTYTFSNLSTGTEYNFRVYAVDTNGISSNVYTLSESTLELTLADICSGKSFAECIKAEVYTGDGNEAIYYHDGSGSYTNAAQEGGDNSYRYSGANPNNYVCFASDAAPCPNDNLYRIIGVFGDQVKLIKSTSYGSYAWDTTGTLGENNWQTSDIKPTLNGTYLNSLGEWSNLIEANTTWYLGGSSTNQATPKQFYGYERGTTVYSGRPTSDIGAIGLMYVSDYGYAASPDYWATALSSYNSAASTNWLCLGSAAWTISPHSSYSYDVFYVANHGVLSYLSANIGIAVRPVFYLKSNVAITSGDGSQNSPFRIELG